jgi:hypothetical protein
MGGYRQHVGFLPNRNPYGELLVLGAILALGFSASPRSTPALASRIIAAIGLLISAISLFFYSVSRAGIILFALGVVLWLVFVRA